MIASFVSLVMLSLVVSQDGQSESDQQILDRAQIAFQLGAKLRGTPGESKQFQLAADYYEELRRRGVRNPALFLNLGNAYLLADDIREAILTYRRGLQLNPNNLEMRTNLTYARDQVVYSSADSFARPPESLWPPWLPRWTPGMSLGATFLFYVMSWIGLAHRWAFRPGSWPWLPGIGVAGALCFVVIFLFQKRAEKMEAEYPMVVISADRTYLHKGNHSLYPRAYDTTLNRGVEARLVQIRGNWLQIELAGDQVGWVPRKKAIVDLP
jgi:tetratricopeptide (TPR) repeat protein